MTPAGRGSTGKSYLEKSENEQDRIRRMSKRDQEKYAEEAIEQLNEKGLGRKFGKTLEDEFNIFGPKKRTRRR